MEDAISQARSKAQEAGQRAVEFAQSYKTAPDQLRRAINEALDYNKDIIGERSKAFGEYQAAPAQAEARFGVETNPQFIFNPFQRNAAIADFIRQRETPFTFYNTLLGQQQGMTSDIVGAGQRAMESQLLGAQGAAELARTGYTDLLAERELQEKIRQADEQLAIQRAQEARLGRTGDGLDLSFLSNLFSQGAGERPSLEKIITGKKKAAKPKQKEKQSVPLTSGTSFATPNLLGGFQTLSEAPIPLTQQGPTPWERIRDFFNINRFAPPISPTLNF